MEASAADAGNADAGKQQPAEMVTRLYDLGDLLAQGAPAGPARGGDGKAEMLTGIVDVIRETVEPGTWKGNGGSITTIKQSQIAVTHTHQCQEEVYALLNGLRQANNVQITVEVCLVGLNREALRPEDQKWMGDLNRAGRTLGDTDVQRLINIAAQAGQGAIVTAPRVTVFNGGDANVEVWTATPYVAGIKPREAGKGYDPVIQQAKNGISMDVQAAATLDRRSVVLHVAPRLSRLLGILSFSFMTKPEKLTVQEPQTSEWELDTQAIVPAGQTVILGHSQVQGTLEVPVARKGPTTGPQAEAAHETLPLTFDIYVLAKATIVGPAAKNAADASAPAMDFGSDMVTQVYDVADLAVQTSRPRQSRTEPNRVPQQAGCDLITENVGAGTWEGKLGGKGLIRFSPIGQQLIIRQTPDVQEDIAQLLAEKHEERALQVAVETLFIAAKASTLQDIGMDLAAREKLSAPSGSTTKAAVIGTYLKDAHYRFLVDRVTKDGGRIIAAPSLMVLNGAEGTIRQMDVQRYVGSVKPTTRPSGEVLYATKQEQAEDGVSFQVHANVSKDHKHVTLYLRPVVSRILNMDQFTFNQAPGGSAISIQQPVEQHTEVETLVSVPDGDWLLLGGQIISEPGHKSPADGDELLLILVRARIVGGSGPAASAGALRQVASERSDAAPR